MTHIHISPSFPDGLGDLRSEKEVRAEHSLSMMQVIRGGAAGKAVHAKRSGMSDDQLAREYDAQTVLKNALAIMRGAIELVNEQSAVVSISANAWSDFLHDQVPDEQFWDDRIRDARTI